jgi:catechol 2,3-dioxygenase-like lactoylglutathione lyase family enzyme
MTGLPGPQLWTLSPEHLPVPWTPSKGECDSSGDRNQQSAAFPVGRPEVTPSPFASLGALSSVMRLVPPDLLRRLAAARGYSETGAQSVEARTKQFQVQPLHRRRPTIARRRTHADGLSRTLGDAESASERETFMNQKIGCVALVVRDYDEAIAFYTQVMGFDLIEDTVLEGGKRWVLVAPEGLSGTALLLARAATPEQEARIGNQTGGRVFLFLHTDDFWRDYHALRSRGIQFETEPRQEEYGAVAVFADLYGNRWDLVEPKRA